MSEYFGWWPDFGETDFSDSYDCPNEETFDDEATVDPVEIDASEDGAASGDKMKIDPLGGESSPVSFGGCDGCSGDCSGSCWLTCSGSCKHSWSGTMN